MYEICPKCKNKKEDVCFAKCKTHKDFRQSYCKECMAKIMIDRYHLNKERESLRNKSLEINVKREIDRIKSEKGCLLCEEKNFVCLDFHHVKKKRKDVSYWVKAKSLKRALEEIEKCICVCANCHRKIHAGLISVP